MFIDGPKGLDVRSDLQELLGLTVLMKGGSLSSGMTCMCNGTYGCNGGILSSGVKMFSVGIIFAVESAVG